MAQRNPPAAFLRTRSDMPVTDVIDPAMSSASRHAVSFFLIAGSDIGRLSPNGSRAVKQSLSWLFFAGLGYPKTMEGLRASSS